MTPHLGFLLALTCTIIGLLVLCAQAWIYARTGSRLTLAFLVLAAAQVAASLFVAWRIWRLVPRSGRLP